MLQLYLSKLVIFRARTIGICYDFDTGVLFPALGTNVLLQVFTFHPECHLSIYTHVQVFTFHPEFNLSIYTHVQVFTFHPEFNLSIYTHVQVFTFHPECHLSIYTHENIKGEAGMSHGGVCICTHILSPNGNQFETTSRGSFCRTGSIHIDGAVKMQLNQWDPDPWCSVDRPDPWCSVDRPDPWCSVDRLALDG